ncbi:protein kinase [Nocardia takedensis]
MTVHWAEAVTRFTAAWRRALHGDRPPPELAEFLPDAGVARAAVLTDLIRIDLRHRWERPGEGRTVGSYRADYPEMADSPALVELICEEFAARRDRAPLPLTDFLADYPDFAAAVRERLEQQDLAADTAALTLDRPLGALEAGQRLDDFDLRTELDAVAPGRCFLARQRSMQRLVAVWLFEGHGDRHRVARLDHPHILRVFDHRPLLTPTGSGRLVYTQYLPGGTARDVLDRVRTGPETDGGALLLRSVDAAMERTGEIRPADSPVRAELARLSWPETVAWLGRRLADAVDHADRHGVRYRALTPDTVLFTAEGEPKIADIADAAADPAYRAPEDPATAVDQRPSVYSLGLLLWELLTGARPFADTDDTATRRAGPPEAALRRLPADCPAALRRVLTTCLEYDPDRRWADAAILARQLDLCLDPRARDLVDPPQHSPRRRLRRWRIPLITLAIAVPNALASVFNVDYNRMLIIDKLTDQAAHQLDIGTAIVNSVGFGFGTVILAYFGRHLILVPYGLRRGGRFSEETLSRARTDAIVFGDRAVAVIFTLWMLSGMSFPLVIRGTSDAIRAYDYTHFIAMHAICGAVALVYPFFLVNFYVVRCLYPMFLAHGDIGGDATDGGQDAVRLRKLRRRSGIWLVVAASIPLAAVAGATLLTPADLTEIIVEVRVLALGSLIAFVGVYLLSLAMEKDLRALERVQAPAGVQPP